MADVFISFGSPDRACVDALAARLTTVGIDFFKYDHDGRGTEPGEGVGEQVARQISSAKIAILCLSNTSLERLWIQRECFACFCALASENRVMRKLLIVRVGELSSRNVPSYLGDSLLYNVWSPQATQRDTTRLINDIRVALNLTPPRVIPAVLLAMRGNEPAALTNHVLLPSVRGLLEHAGVGWTDPLPAELLARYGPESLDFSPYPERTMVSLVAETVTSINSARSAHDPRAAPIHVAWYDPTWLLSDQADAEFARSRHFGSGQYLVVVDSVSLLHPRVRDEFNGVTLATERTDVRALIWVPPHTRHSGAAEEQARLIFSGILPLEPAFTAWKEVFSRSVAFDAPGATSAKRWCHAALSGFLVDEGPLPSRLNEVGNEGSEVKIKPALFFG
jgi:hypothetical protein